LHFLQAIADSVLDDPLHRDARFAGHHQQALMKARVNP
jgi:hypothetical protein